MYRLTQRNTKIENKFLRACYIDDITQYLQVESLIFYFKNSSSRRTNKLRYKILQRGFLIACRNNNRSVIEILFKYTSEKTRRRALKFPSMTDTTKELLTRLKLNM